MGPMTDIGHTLAVYLRLANASQMRCRPHACDQFLVLAGVVAVELEFDAISAGCRALVLLHNRQHMLRRWPSLEAALASDDFLCLLKQIRRRYPQEKAEQLLQSLDLDVLREREDYLTDLEHAQAQLNELALQRGGERLF